MMEIDVLYDAPYSVMMIIARRYRVQYRRHHWRTTTQNLLFGSFFFPVYDVVLFIFNGQSSTARLDTNVELDCIQ